MRKSPWNGDDLIAGYFHHPRRWRYISFKIRALDVAAVARGKNAIWVAVGAIAARQLSSVLVLELCSAGIISVCASLIFDSGV